MRKSTDEPRWGHVTATRNRAMDAFPPSRRALLTAWVKDAVGHADPDVERPHCPECSRTSWGTPRLTVAARNRLTGAKQNGCAVCHTSWGRTGTAPLEWAVRPGLTKETKRKLRKGRVWNGWSRDAQLLATFPWHCRLCDAAWSATSEQERDLVREAHTTWHRDQIARYEALEASDPAAAADLWDVRYETNCLRCRTDLTAATLERLRALVAFHECDPARRFGGTRLD